MDKDELSTMMSGFKNKKTSFKADTVAYVRDALKVSRQDVLNLSMQQIMQLAGGILENDAVSELSRNGEVILLNDIISKPPRKGRNDKGVPRKVEDVAEEGVDDEQAVA